MSKKVAEELQKIYEDKGQLTADDVVDTASDPQHPLHTRFEWDDSKAGRRHRVDQARRLIRSCKITYREDAAPRPQVRAFTHVVRRTDGVGTYMPSEDVAADPIARQVTLNQMRREWLVFKKRYQNFDEFSQMVLDDMGEKLAETS